MTYGHGLHFLEALNPVLSLFFQELTEYACLFVGSATQVMLPDSRSGCSGI